MSRTLYWVNQFAVLPDQPGGTRHYEMSRELVHLGVKTTVVASDLNLSRRTYLRRRGLKDRRHLREEVDGVQFVWLPAGHYQTNDWRRAFSMLVFSLHALWFLFRAPMPRGSVIIGSSPHLPAAAAARVAAFVRRVPFVFEVRDLWPETLAVSGNRPGIMYRVLRLLADLLYRSSLAIIVLAAGNADRVADRGAPRARIHYVPNGVDPAVFEAEAPTQLPGGVPLDRRVFLYAGAHGPANGLETVVDAAEVLMQRGEGRAQVVLLGDGPSKAGLVASVRRRGLDNVTFLDPVPKSEIPGLMKSCAAGIMPLADIDLFSYGVSPNKLFDYLSAGLPVITNVPGDVARMVLEARAGIVVPPADVPAFADAMVRVLDGDEIFESGLSWIRKHHDRTLLARRLVGVIEAVSTK